MRTQLRHQKPFSYVGLWPELSLINHSSSPNISFVVIKDRMLVRADFHCASEHAWLAPAKARLALACASVCRRRVCVRVSCLCVGITSVCGRHVCVQARMQACCADSAPCWKRMHFRPVLSCREGPGMLSM